MQLFLYRRAQKSEPVGSIRSITGFAYNESEAVKIANWYIFDNRFKHSKAWGLMLMPAVIFSSPGNYKSTHLSMSLPLHSSLVPMQCIKVSSRSKIMSLFLPPIIGMYTFLSLINSFEIGGRALKNKRAWRVCSMWSLLKHLKGVYWIDF